jgi:hypothetical protein
MGIALGRAGPVAYPYRDALRRTRAFTLVMLALSILLALLVLFLFFVVGVAG